MRVADGLFCSEVPLFKRLKDSNRMINEPFRR